MGRPGAKYHSSSNHGRSDSAAILHRVLRGLHQLGRELLVHSHASQPPGGPPHILGAGEAPSALTPIPQFLQLAAAARCRPGVLLRLCGGLPMNVWSMKPCRSGTCGRGEAQGP
jgi:hypothetical protein